MYYVLSVGGIGTGAGSAQGKARADARGLMRILATLPNCQGQRAYEDPFLHTLVNLINFFFFFMFK